MHFRYHIEYPFEWIKWSLWSLVVWCIHSDFINSTNMMCDVHSAPSSFSFHFEAFAMVIDVIKMWCHCYWGPLQVMTVQRMVENYEVNAILIYDIKLLLHIDCMAFNLSNYLGWTIFIEFNASSSKKLWIWI